MEYKRRLVENESNTVKNRYGSTDNRVRHDFGIWRRKNLIKNDVSFETEVLHGTQTVGVFHGRYGGVYENEKLCRLLQQDEVHRRCDRKGTAFATVNVVAQRAELKRNCDLTHTWNFI